MRIMAIQMRTSLQKFFFQNLWIVTKKFELHSHPYPPVKKGFTSTILQKRNSTEKHCVLWGILNRLTKLLSAPKTPPPIPQSPPSPPSNSHDPGSAQSPIWISAWG